MEKICEKYLKKDRLSKEEINLLKGKKHKSKEDRKKKKKHHKKD